MLRTGQSGDGVLADVCCRVNTAATGKVTEQQEGSASVKCGCGEDGVRQSVIVSRLRHSPV